MDLKAQGRSADLLCSTMYSPHYRHVVSARLTWIPQPH